MRVRTAKMNAYNRNRPTGIPRLNGAPPSGALVFCALILLVSLTGCASGVRSTAGHAPTDKSSKTPSKSVPCATGSLQLIGSSAFLPVAQRAAEAYRHYCTNVTINVTGGDSAYGLSVVRQAVASNSKSAGSMIAMYDGSTTQATGLRPYSMGVLIYSVVAHTGLFPAANITSEQLRKIFVKPYERGIIAVGRRAGSGSRQAFNRNVLGFYPGPPDKGNCPKPTGRAISFTSCTEDSTPDLLKFVNETPNAIGYAEIFGQGSDYSKISVLSIDNATPTQANVANGSYKFWTIEHLYASPKLTALARDFLEFLSTYNPPNLPPDFVSCSDATQAVGAAC